MINFEALQDLSQQTRPNRAQQEVDKLLEEAHDRLINWSNRPNKLELQAICNQLLKCQEIKRSEPRVYLYLALIYYTLDQDKLALRYLHWAEELHADPEQCKRLRASLQQANAPQNQLSDDEIAHLQPTAKQAIQPLLKRLRLD